jgi:hypothetical protein
MMKKMIFREFLTKRRNLLPLFVAISAITAILALNIAFKGEVAVERSEIDERLAVKDRK